MFLGLSAKLHAFLGGLFQQRDDVETRQLFDEVSSLFGEHELASPEERNQLMVRLAIQVSGALALDDDSSQRQNIVRYIRVLFDYEDLFLLPEIDWTERRSVSQYWALRDQLNAQRKLVDNFEQTIQHIAEFAFFQLEPIFKACPQLCHADENDDDIAVPTALTRMLGDTAQVVWQVLGAAYLDDLKESEFFPKHLARYERNLVAASGGNPDDADGFKGSVIEPKKSRIKNPDELIATYLAGTPIHHFFDQSIDFLIPTKTRFEHHHVVAGSGHGKTQCLQYLIAHDIEAMKRHKRSVVVIDSQGDLIKNISKMAEFAPGGELHEKIVIIDPTDIEYPVSLNLFDVGMHRLEGYGPLERERLTNSILELYDFVLGTLLDAGMTQKQSVIFRYVTRLMLHIPNATIHTLRELMEPDGLNKHLEHVTKLTGSARHFFETEFKSGEFSKTKQQVLRRLWGILENQTFERMFSHPRSKLDLFTELNEGKIILINTAKDLLKENGTEIFGRFFIALIAQAAQERAILPKNERVPTFVYIDEAADYFDRNIGIILSTARKYNIGMILAHQFLGQLDPKLQEAFSANTSIKFAGGVSAKDAKTLGPMLYAEPGMIEVQRKGSFASYVRDVTTSAIPLKFPFGHLENLASMSKKQRQHLQERMRELYAVHYSELSKDEGTPDTSEDGSPTNGDNSDPSPKNGGDEPGQDPGQSKPPSTDPTPQW